MSDIADFAKAPPSACAELLDMSESELRAVGLACMESIQAISAQIEAEECGQTSRGRAWRAQATTARAHLESRLRTVRREIGRHEHQRGMIRKRERHERQARVMEAKQAGKTARMLAVRFQEAAKARLPADVYESIMQKAAHDG